MYNKLKNEKLKKARGITLIALVITVIVLLILAGVSIGMLTGSNGLIDNTYEAKDAMEKANVKETIQVEVLKSYDDMGNIDIEKLNENLSTIPDLFYGDKKIDPKENPIPSLPADVVLNGYTAHIDKNGTVTMDGEELEDDEESDNGEGSENNPVFPPSSKYIDMGSYLVAFSVTAREEGETVYANILTYSNPIESENFSQKVVIQKNDLGNISNEAEIEVICVYTSQSIEPLYGEYVKSGSFTDGEDELEFNFDFGFNYRKNSFVDAKTMSFDAN